MAEWTREKGPPCYCGFKTTWVEPSEDGPPTLICFAHTKASGAAFPLPKDRPDNWPDLTKEELNACMLRGAEEAEASDVAT